MTNARVPLPPAEAMHRSRVLVVGDVMLDRYWFGAVDRISPEAPVPVVRVTREEDRLGGAANVAVNSQALEAQVTLLTVVGDDEPATRLEELLASRQIRAVLRRDPALKTIVKLRVIGRSQQLLRVDFENTPDHEVLNQMFASFEEQLSQHDVVVFSDYGKGGLAHIPQMIQRARAAGLPVLVDPKGSDYARYAGASALTPNRSELALITGPWRDEAHLTELAQNLRRELRLQALLLTRSEEGMTLFDDAGAHHVPAEAREVFDVTGAGDTVIATLASLLGTGMPLAQAVPWANHAASLVVGKFGTASISHAELLE
ncbi:D-glycero-beta-D-manno-heptose-7-phosphate kinase [Ideonella dechloratans]|uniref:D-glycero-beta-D-manno-heptose-7-phosphate kinase n=1 Tax=Ideonella dechloratans TaxID=36863 RepID=A0A643FDD3_IDEDE|nr:D-glycero-beta-D-manno-heptose-7-phosphate kinase [Ideonella dechloratans]KAB0583523.1 D-glycero-beta-D-manno-heptose-7-phosphate kinase [Ideonella dechloratans]UFU09064.1 D-glycero-beta-D-manno-heptose-7-phosphate kinase [Ideonella dechloratans]